LVRKRSGVQIPSKAQRIFDDILGKEEVRAGRPVPFKSPQKLRKQEVSLHWF
jgi:hypothetical protein